ncbi:transcriptional regulator with XRE-family HTH domain [Stella humosa]|uniref:Transcriptional regulator with XRE-family HTH domain n=1 Tax=Stella humosa TaxID=94 RepID=A0A3N1KWT4_9PROT|nr:helix-turn-helix transcriptional regulator [Stella humosa]ROP83932.1 transcriptional regulator with XRE-family HTH domain [Stella humosa]BBK33439.1 transcriptional regulator [Stella humosa]
MRLYRTVAGLSQTQLAETIGLTFQQVQKYERGSNRISASVLTRISATLGVAVDAFFPNEGVEALESNDGIMLRREAIELARAFERLQDPELRSAVMDLVVKLGHLVPAPKPIVAKRPAG